MPFWSKMRHTEKSETWGFKTAPTFSKMAPTFFKTALTFEKLALTFS